MDGGSQYRRVSFGLYLGFLLARVYTRQAVPGSEARSQEEARRNRTLRVHLVNPSDVSFGIGVITPRWLFVLAAATPAQYGDPIITDETLEPFDPVLVHP